MSDLIPVEAVEAAAKIAAEDDAEPNGPHRVRNRPATNPRLDQQQQTGGEMSEDMRLEAALRRNARLEKKAAKANLELEKARQENARLRMENNIQLGWLNAEDSYTRRYNALEARVNIIRDVLSDNFPKKYGQPGAYNWFGEK